MRQGDKAEAMHGGPEVAPKGEQGRLAAPWRSRGDPTFRLQQALSSSRPRPLPTTHPP